MATACYPLLALYSELLLIFYVIMYDPELDRGLFHTTLMNTSDDNNSHKCDLRGTVSNFMYFLFHLNLLEVLIKVVKHGIVFQLEKLYLFELIRINYLISYTKNDTNVK